MFNYVVLFAQTCESEYKHLKFSEEFKVTKSITVLKAFQKSKQYALSMLPISSLSKGNLLQQLTMFLLKEKGW